MSPPRFSPLSNVGKSTLVRVFRSPLQRGEDLPEGPSQYHSINQEFMAQWLDEKSPLWVKAIRVYLKFATWHLKDPESISKYSLLSDYTKISPLGRIPNTDSGEHQALLITWQIPSLLVGAASCSEGTSQLQGQRDCSELRERWMLPNAEKEKVHWKMKIHSLSTHHYANGEVGKVQKTRVNSVAAKSNISNMNAGAYGHLDDTTGAVWRHVMLFSVVFYIWRSSPPVTSIVLDLAATLFTPKTPKVFCGLKQFIHLSFRTVVSR